MPRLYATGTHYISMAFGEGWDQAMVEAAASGLKLIAPDHSAYRAYLDSSVATLIPSREVPADFGSDDPDTAALFEYGNWWKPDEVEAIACTQRAIAEADRANPLLRDRMLAEFNWASATRRLIAILGDLEARSTQPRLWTPFPGYTRVGGPLSSCLFLCRISRFGIPQQRWPTDTRQRPHPSTRPILRRQAHERADDYGSSPGRFGARSGSVPPLEGCGAVKRTRSLFPTSSIRDEILA